MSIASPLDELSLSIDPLTISKLRLLHYMVSLHARVLSSAKVLDFITKRLDDHQALSASEVKVITSHLKEVGDQLTICRTDKPFATLQRLVLLQSIQLRTSKLIHHYAPLVDYRSSTLGF